VVRLLAVGNRRTGTRSEGTAVKITLDSTEPLEDAIRVLGAMYDVTLVVSQGQVATAPLENGSSTSSSTPVQSPKKQRRSRSDKRDSTAGSPAATSAESGLRSVSKVSGRPSNADVRTWARENGLTVSDRGRLAGSVLAAYQSANNK
jgi:hypothetical protein